MIGGTVRNAGRYSPKDVTVRRGKMKGAQSAKGRAK